MDAAQTHWSHETLLRSLEEEADRRGIAGPAHHCFHCGGTASEQDLPFSAYQRWEYKRGSRMVRIGV